MTFKDLKNFLPSEVIAYLCIFLIVFGASVWIVSESVTTILDGNKAKVESNIGSKFILEKDTVLVVDYSYLKDNYTLLNGTEISSTLISKLQKVK